MTELESHPGVLLEQHLKEVWHRVKTYLSDLPMPLEFYNAAKVAAFGHDLGKATRFFQEHLHNQKGQTSLTSHALLSAVLALNSIGWQLPLELKLAVFLSIKAHHSNLGNVDDELALKMKWETLEKQVRGIDRRQFSSLLSEIGFSTSSSAKLLPSFEAFRKDFLWPASDLKGDMGRYFSLNLLLGMLVDADIRSVMGMEPSAERVELPSEMVDQYLEALPKDSPIDDLRRQFYELVIQNTLRFGLDHKIMSITAPTGIGKTLAGLSVALKLRNLVTEKSDSLPRIIYALPFTSIIDQNYDVFWKVLEHSEIPEAALLKHHHRSQPIIGLEDSKLSSLEAYERAFTRTDTWDSEIIVTTFVQVLETLFTNSRSNMRRLHRLAGSILILDEVQNIPVEQWESTERTLRHFSKVWNTRIVLMTATQPVLLPDAYELTEPHKQIFFKKLSRTNLSFEPDPVPYSDVSRWLIPKIRGSTSFMAIVNTVRAAQEIYGTLKNGLNEYNLFFLSASLIPLHREERILRISELLREEPQKRIGLVATQVVEAGVDLDFETVIRDLAPLDSVVQAAGRCNRNSRSTDGTVHLVVLREENRKQRLSSYLYDAVMLEQTLKEIQKCDNHLVEANYSAVVETYFRALRDPENLEQGSKRQDKTLIEDIKVLNYESIGMFRLIPNIGYHTPVFIEWDSEATQIVKRLVKLEQATTKGFEARMDRRRRFLAIKPLAWRYIVNVPNRVLRRNPLGSLPFLSSVLYLPREHPEFNKLYSKELGFSRKAEHEAIFL